MASLAARANPSGSVTFERPVGTLLLQAGTEINMKTGRWLTSPRDSLTAKSLVRRVGGEVVLGRFHIYKNAVYQALSSAVVVSSGRFISGFCFPEKIEAAMEIRDFFLDQYDTVCWIVNNLFVKDPAVPHPARDEGENR
jgi:hypothetical protein